MELQRKINELSLKLKGAVIFESQQRVREDVLNRKIRDMFVQIETEKKRALAIHQALLSPVSAQMHLISSILEKKILTTSNVLKTSDLITRFLADKDELARRIVSFCEQHHDYVDDVTFSLMPSCFRQLSSVESQNDYFLLLQRVFALNQDLCARLARACFVSVDFLNVMDFACRGMRIQLLDVVDGESAEAFLTEMLEALKDCVDQIPPLLTLIAKSEMGPKLFEEAFFTELIANPHLYFVTGMGDDRHVCLDCAKKPVLDCAEKFGFCPKIMELLNQRHAEDMDTIGMVQKTIPQFASTYFFTQRDLQLMEAILNQSEELPSFPNMSYEVVPIYVSAYKVEPKTHDKGATLDCLLRDLITDSDPGVLVDREFDDVMEFVEMACVEMAPSNLAMKQRIRFELFQKLLQKDGTRQFTDVLKTLEAPSESSSVGHNPSLLSTYTNLVNEMKHDMLVAETVLTGLSCLCKFFLIDCCFETDQLRFEPGVMRDRGILTDRVQSLKTALEQFLHANNITAQIEGSLLLSRIFNLNDYDYFIKDCPEVLELNNAFLANSDSLLVTQMQETNKLTKVLEEQQDRFAAFAEAYRRIIDSNSTQATLFQQVVSLVNELNEFLVIHLGEVGADEKTPAFHYVVFNSKAQQFASKTEYIYRTFMTFYSDMTHAPVSTADTESLVILSIGILQLILGKCNDEALSKLSWSTDPDTAM